MVFVQNSNVGSHCVLKKIYNCFLQGCTPMMRSKHYTIEEWDTKPIRKIPSLVDLCVQKAVDNVRYLGDVGETDFHLLERFLPHCTVEQLMHIEDSTEV